MSKVGANVKKQIFVILPSFIKNRLKNRPHVQKILVNIGWLSFDKIFQLIFAVVIGIWLVRYLGPGDFGIMNFAFAFSSLFAPLIGLGVGSLMVREIIEHPDKKDIILGSCSFINLVTGFLVFVLINISSYALSSNDLLVVLVVFIYSLTFLIGAPFSVISAWFNSRTESKVGVISYNISLVCSSILKVLLILMGFPLIYFIVVGLIETIIGLFITFYFYRKAGEHIRKWRISFSYIKNILKSSWPLVLSGTMVVLYLKIDQVMLGLLLGNTQVGLYSVSVKLSEIFYFAPGVLIFSLFPIMVASKKLIKEVYLLRLKKLFYLMTWVPFLIIIPFTLFSNQIVDILYGQEFILAGPALAISVWALLAIFVKTATESYLISENLTKIVFINSIIGAIANIGLNLVLIPMYGINGAAIATVISYTMAAYLGLFIFKRTRPIFWMLLKSFNIFKGIKYIKGNWF